MPRVNRAIELLSQDQPIYYTSTHDLTYENGKAMASTWADFINVDMEHHPYDVAGLRKFMEGLVDGGPTKSGHRTPTVIAVVPITARYEYAIRANAWMFTQVLCAGVHGILMTHCNSPAAVRAFVEGCRYPFNRLGVGKGLGEGERGSAGQAHAASIWGLEVPEYLAKADPWPLNPDGELMLGLKIENRHALQYAETSARSPASRSPSGAPATWACRWATPDAPRSAVPGRHVGSPQQGLRGDEGSRHRLPRRHEHRERDRAHRRGRPEIGSAAAARRFAEIGRKHTKRTMPW